MVSRTSIFPSETLAWTAVLRALSYAGISFLVLLVFEVALNGVPPLSILLLPLYPGAAGHGSCLAWCGSWRRSAPLPVTCPTS